MSSVVSQTAADRKKEKRRKRNRKWEKMKKMKKQKCIKTQCSVSRPKPKVFTLSKDERKSFRRQSKNQCGFSSMANAFLGAMNKKDLPSLEIMYSEAEALDKAFAGSPKSSCGSRELGGFFTIEAIQSAMQYHFGNKYVIRKVKTHTAEQWLVQQIHGRFICLTWQRTELGWQKHWLSVAEIRGQMVVLDGARKTCLVLSPEALIQRAAEYVKVYEIISN
jgi:hypothetical protein